MKSPEQFTPSGDPLTIEFASAFDQSRGRPAVIGIGAFTHDTSAALVCSTTGRVLYAAPEERLSNDKHDSRFPIGALLRALATALDLGFHVERVAVAFDPSVFISDRVFDELPLPDLDPSVLAHARARLRQLAFNGVPLDVHRTQPIDAEVADVVRSVAGTDPAAMRAVLHRLTWYFNMAAKYESLAAHIRWLFHGTIVSFVNHHDAHAATAFFGCGRETSAVLVVDGHGEVDTTTIFRGDNAGLTRLAQTEWPVSLGSIYLAITRHLGFDYGDEYKVMGMAAYGRPTYLEHFHNLVTVRDGVLQLQPSSHFHISTVGTTGQRRVAVTPSFEQLCPRRTSTDDIEQPHFDLAASVQAFIEQIGVELARDAVRLTGCRSLAIAGGVGLNGLMNNAIRTSGVCDDIFIYPAASDDGTCVGAALAGLLPVGLRAAERMTTCYYGRAAAAGEIEGLLNDRMVAYSRPASINRTIAEALAEGHIVARYNGAAEFGPRALGNRSILANPMRAEMKETLNVRIKHREPFRPFAPACLRDQMDGLFALDEDAPFMILIVQATERAHAVIPAVVHNDGSARVQTVTSNQNPDFYRTISEFHRITGVPVVINTSFNLNKEAIVDSPVDALESFAFMDIDFLAIGDFWVAKGENPTLLPTLTHAEFLGLRKARYAASVTHPFREMDVRKYGEWFYPTENALQAWVEELCT